MDRVIPALSRTKQVAYTGSVSDADVRRAPGLRARAAVVLAVYDPIIFGDSRSNGFRDVRGADFVSNEHWQSLSE